MYVPEKLATLFGSGGKPGTFRQIQHLGGNERVESVSIAAERLMG